MTDALYEWPETARVGKPVPKQAFYDNSKVAAAVRMRFVADVEQITWAYKLSERTTNLVATAGVPEIQVFVVTAKTDDVSEVVLSAIDKSVHTPIVFEVRRQQESQSRMTAAPKTLRAGAQPQIGRYVSTEWIDDNQPRRPLPAALDLTKLYTGLVSPLLPVIFAPGEQLKELVDRAENTRKLERRMATFKNKLRNEQQFNRKVELLRQIRECEAALATISSITTAHEESSWRS